MSLITHLFSLLPMRALFSTFFFFNDTATTEIYTLSLHDALPISLEKVAVEFREVVLLADVEEFSYREIAETLKIPLGTDRKSTRLNSSHGYISYAVFCLKKKKKKQKNITEDGVTQ